LGMASEECTPGKGAFSSGSRTGVPISINEPLQVGHSLKGDRG